MRRPPKKIIGQVLSTAMDRTAVVEVQRLYVHSLVRKIIKHRRKYFVHDHHELLGVGDRVEIKFAGRLSKKKRWTVVDIIDRMPRLEGEPFPMSELKTAPKVSLTQDVKVVSEA